MRWPSPVAMLLQNRRFPSMMMARWLTLRGCSCTSQEFGFDRLAEHITHAFRDTHAFLHPVVGEPRCLIAPLVQLFLQGQFLIYSSFKKSNISSDSDLSCEPESTVAFWRGPRGSVQPLSEYLDSSSVSVILSCLFFLLLIQEVWVIQWNMREENVEFTRRFNRRFPPGEFSFVRIGPHLVGILGVFIFIALLGFRTDVVALHAVACIFFILKWISDPLLGCLAEYNNRLVQPVFAYVVIYIYATTSSLDSAVFALTPIPWTQSLSLVMFFLAVLQMRMAYYQNSALSRKFRLRVNSILSFFPFSFCRSRSWLLRWMS